jgi:hypothetical protein
MTCETWDRSWPRSAGLGRMFAPERGVHFTTELLPWHNPAPPRIGSTTLRARARVALRGEDAAGGSSPPGRPSQTNRTNHQAENEC